MLEPNPAHQVGGSQLASCASAGSREDPVNALTSLLEQGPSVSVLVLVLHLTYYYLCGCWWHFLPYVLLLPAVLYRKLNSFATYPPVLEMLELIGP